VSTTSPDLEVACRPQTQADDATMVAAIEVVLDGMAIAGGRDVGVPASTRCVFGCGRAGWLRRRERSWVHRGCQRRGRAQGVVMPARTSTAAGKLRVAERKRSGSDRSGPGRRQYRPTVGDVVAHPDQWIPQGRSDGGYRVWVEQ